VPLFESRYEQVIFAIFTDKPNTEYTYFEMKLSDYIKARMALGASRAEVFTELNNDLRNGEGVFRALMGAVDHEVDFGLNGSYQVASNEGVGEVVKWTLNASEHCDSCLYQASLPPRQMSEIPFPGFQPQHGKTNCERYCKCTLEPVS